MKDAMMIRALPALFPRPFFRADHSAQSAQPVRHLARLRRPSAASVAVGKPASEAPRWDAPAHWIEPEREW
ncbi:MULTISPECIES: hypothetical protein [Mameliella]|nr:MULTISPECIES: hypothetical protein [Mameliella]